MATTQETVWVVLNCVIFPQSLWKSSVFYQSLTVVVVWFVWRQRLYCLLTSRTFHGIVQSRTQGYLGFLSAVWSLKNDLRESESINFWIGWWEERWTPHRKCDFQKGSIDVLTIGFFFFFAWKFSIVNFLSMRGKHPTKAAACCNGEKLFFMERWIAVVPAKDVQVQINHFI